MKSANLSESKLQRLFQYAAMLSRNESLAYDLVQQAVESYLLQIKSGVVIDNLDPFLRKCIRHRYIDHYRKEQSQPTQSYEELSSYDISPLELDEVVVNQDELERLWEQLEPVERDIFWHWAVLGYSTDEACDQLGMSRGTFLSRIHRLRKRLRIATAKNEMNSDNSTGQQTTKRGVQNDSK